MSQTDPSVTIKPELNMKRYTINQAIKVKNTKMNPRGNFGIFKFKRVPHFLLLTFSHIGFSQNIVIY